MKLGHKIILILCAGILSIGVISYSIISNFSVQLISMVFIGLGMGTLDLIGVRLIVDYRDSDKGKFLNLSAFFHGLASMVAPIFVGWLLINGYQWREVYQVSLLIILFFLAFFVSSRIPRITNNQPIRGNHLEHLKMALNNKKVWPFYILIICYVAVENGFAVWAVQFLQEGKGLPQETSIAFLSLFFFFLMIGRLIGSFVVEKIGYVRLILICSLGATLCLVGGIVANSFFVYLLPLSGFFLSIIFPTTTAAASEDMQGDKSIQFGIFFTLAGLGGILGSWAIGILSDLINLQFGFSFLFIMTISITLLIILRMRMKSAPVVD